MRKVVLVLACLVCASHGRGIRSALEESQSSVDAETQLPPKASTLNSQSLAGAKKFNMRENAEDARNPLKALAMFLTAFNPVAVLRPGSGPSFAVGKPSLLSSRLSHCVPMMSMEDEISTSGLETVEAKLLRATPQIEMQMRTIDGAPIGPPPDMPSLLLDERIVYIGAPLVPSVSELIVAELLYLNFNKPDEDVQMYINSIGTAGGATETDAFAILDTMSYITPSVGTCCIGSAFGTAAMLLAAGAKGKRVCLPNAQIILVQPSSQTRGQASDIAIRAREVLATRKLILSTLSEMTGQSLETLQKDTSRTKYLSAQEALDYGIVDRVANATRVAVDLTSKLS